MHEDRDTARSDSEVGSVEIVLDIAESLNYACWQNSIPFLRSLKIRNGTQQSWSDLRLELESAPPVARRKVWAIDRLGPGDELAVTDKAVDLDPDYLVNLDEAERSRVTVKLKAGEELIAEIETEARLLARDEWGGFGSMASLLAAFVMPNDPAVAKILKDAAKVLGDHGHATALDGYQSEDPRRAYMLVASIWSAIAARRLTYAEPPRSFERTGQKVRRPSTVLDQGLATCLDTTLLFASAVEAVGLNPIVAVVEGHTFAGAWLVKKTFPNLFESDPAELRKAIAARELLTFETTIVTANPPSMFADAIQVAARRSIESEEDHFIGAIDIVRARMSQIRPMASHQRAENATTSDAEAVALPLPPLPTFGVMPSGIAEEKPSTAGGRIDRWQRKLLDLSLRNRLLNFKDGKAVVPFVCPSIHEMEDRLASGAKIRVISLPEQNPLGDRDKKQHLLSTGQDLDTEFARQALERDELSSPLSGSELTTRLTELYRKAQSDLAEGGTNTLFLAVGFLRWKRTAEDQKSYRAPLLLVPVKLERRSASSRFSLAHHEDDVRFNATLIHLLKKDFDLDLPALDLGLPTDQSGIDVPQVLEKVRRAVRDASGFEVVDETALSTFSFAKYLMWKDLVDRTDSLRSNRVVRHLIDNPDQVFEQSGATAFPVPRDIDVMFEPSELFTPLPSDSSQIAAVIAAAKGKDFVLIGPPGTGKSQTIANMIAQCLASGKSVLFVAEKTAALDVVYRRLREQGLGPYCLELHSNKAERKHFVDQLKLAWEAHTAGSSDEWLRLNGRLKIRRDELNRYVEEIHRKAPDGISLYEAFGADVRNKDRDVPALGWPQHRRLDAGQLALIEDRLRELASTYKAARAPAAFRAIKASDWSVAWEQRLLAAAQVLNSSISALSACLGSLSPLLGLGARSDGSQEEIRNLARVTAAVLAASEGNYGIMLRPDFDSLRTSVAAVSQSIDALHQAASSLTAIYTEDDIARIRVDELDHQWRSAKAAIWPKSTLEKNKIRKILESYAKSGSPDPETDLPLLRQMQMHLATVSNSPLVDSVPGWNGTQTDISKVEKFFADAEKTKTAIMAISGLATSPQVIVQALSPYLLEGQRDHPVRSASTEYLTAFKAFVEAIKGFTGAGGGMPYVSGTMSVLEESQSTLSEIVASRAQLQAWTSWCGIREKAEGLGLDALVVALETGQLNAGDLVDAFRLSYIRWRLPIALSENEIVQNFRRFKHEDALADFRQLDDLARAHAADEVRRQMSRDLPQPTEVARQSELGLLRHQMSLQKPSRSIRELISAMPESFGKLAPCLMMSPLSIAQYLPADQALFDVVIFDEASQIATWDAVGALARGRQAVIVGDPKQLPPTNFFGRSESEDEDPEIQHYEKDLESILDESRAAGIPVMDLNWHYRSRHESLIAFSNWHYYGNRLVTFPSPFTDDRAVSLEFIADGVYDRGKSRTNRAEAERIASDATRMMLDWLKLPEIDRPTLGCITFNSQQQSLIEDLLDQRRTRHPEIEWFFDKNARIEPVIVKNLENVQGDERDVMLFSITFGDDQAARFSKARRSINSFGAINREGGERRLNVAVTRARQKLAVYASITADRIDESATKSLGVRHLKTFLDYAQRGPIALASADKGSVGTFDSPFEEAVAEALERRGWIARPQIGVSVFRVDLGIVHPDKPGRFLAGVECDGATYHRSATAKDRDKVREQVLRGLGWQILRVWSPDWWYDKEGATERIHEALNVLLDQDRAEDARIAAELEASAASQPSVEEHFAEVDAPVETATSAEEDVLEVDKAPVEQEPAEADIRTSIASEDAGMLRFPISALPTVEAAPPMEFRSNVAAVLPVVREPLPAAGTFRRADLSGVGADPEAFFEFSYRATLDAMVAAVVEAESPVRDDVLAQRIARAHGWQRTGARIRERIELHLKKYETTTDSAGRFIWATGATKPIIPFRPPLTEDDRRPVSDIAIVELAGFVKENIAVLEESDPALVVARLIGLERLTAGSRARIDEAIELARSIGAG
jgi:hypothetical protein